MCILDAISRKKKKKSSYISLTQHLIAKKKEGGKKKYNILLGEAELINGLAVKPSALEDPALNPSAPSWVSTFSGAEKRH